jgi:hypothetical protein
VRPLVARGPVVPVAVAVVPVLVVLVQRWLRSALCASRQPHRW